MKYIVILVVNTRKYALKSIRCWGVDFRHIEIAAVKIFTKKCIL